MATLDAKIGLRHFKEKVAHLVQTHYPCAADLYREGNTARQIDEKLGISQEHNFEAGRTVDTAILEALGGYVTLNKKDVPGLLPRDEYEQIAVANQYSKGVSGGVRQKKAKHASDTKMRGMGFAPWSDEERYDVWLMMYCPDFHNARGVKRGEIADVLNKLYHGNKFVRDPSHVRNKATYYKNIRKVLD